LHTQNLALFPETGFSIKYVLFLTKPSYLMIFIQWHHSYCYQPLKYI